MPIIKLDAIDSTNSYLRRLSVNEVVEDFTVVTAKVQTNGRGQMGTYWQSQVGKNLIFSVFKDFEGFTVEYPFYISIVTALAIIKTLHSFSIPKLNVKWPNDILSGDFKISGVLIENVIKQSQIKASILGIGLNVNQTDFENLPKASSLKNISGRLYDIDEIMHFLLKHLKDYFLILKARDYKLLMSEYEAHLYRKDKPSTFKDASGFIFSGYIECVTDSGSLKVLLEDQITKEFDMKEIALLY